VKAGRARSALPAGPAWAGGPPRSPAACRFPPGRRACLVLRPQLPVAAVPSAIDRHPPGLAPLPGLPAPMVRQAPEVRPATPMAQAWPSARAPQPGSNIPLQMQTCPEGPFVSRASRPQPSSRYRNRSG
jgi:hypothetical protein